MDFKSVRIGTDGYTFVKGSRNRGNGEFVLVDVDIRRNVRLVMLPAEAVNFANALLKAADRVEADAEAEVA